MVLPVSRLSNLAQIAACTQIKGDIHRYVSSTSSPLCDIGEPRYRQNNTGYQVLRIGYYSKFDYLDNLILCIVLPIYRLPDIAQKTACTQNVPMDVTFHLRYVPAS